MTLSGKHWHVRYQTPRLFPSPSFQPNQARSLPFSIRIMLRSDDGGFEMSRQASSSTLNQDEHQEPTARELLLSWARAHAYRDRATAYLKRARSESDTDVRDYTDQLLQLMKIDAKLKNLQRNVTCHKLCSNSTAALRERPQVRGGPSCR